MNIIMDAHRNDTKFYLALSSFRKRASDSIIDNKENDGSVIDKVNHFIRYCREVASIPNNYIDDNVSGVVLDERYRASEKVNSCLYVMRMLKFPDDTDGEVIDFIVNFIISNVISRNDYLKSIRYVTNDPHNSGALALRVECALMNSIDLSPNGQYREDIEERRAERKSNDEKLLELANNKDKAISDNFYNKLEDISISTGYNYMPIDSRHNRNYFNTNYNDYLVPNLDRFSIERMANLKSISLSNHITRFNIDNVRIGRLVSNNQMISINGIRCYVDSKDYGELVISLSQLSLPTSSEEDIAMIKEFGVFSLLNGLLDCQCDNGVYIADNIEYLSVHAGIIDFDKLYDIVATCGRLKSIHLNLYTAFKYTYTDRNNNRTYFAYIDLDQHLIEALASKGDFSFKDSHSMHVEILVDNFLKSFNEFHEYCSGRYIKVVLDDNVFY